MALFSSPHDRIDLSNYADLFRNFCQTLDPEESTKYGAGKSFLIYARVILCRISKGDFRSRITDEAVQQALSKLHLDLCKAFLATVIPKLCLLEQKKYQTHKVKEAIHEFEHQYQKDPKAIPLVKKTMELLIESNLANYHKPAKDPMKINLLNALGTLAVELS